MSEFMDAVSSQAFMQNAILGGFLASVACGVVGSYVVVNRIGYLAENERDQRFTTRFDSRAFRP